GWAAGRGREEGAGGTGGGGSRNGVALYQFPRHRVIHHFIPDPRVRPSALRSLGAFANVFAIEGFLDELAELADEDPVAYRLGLLSDPRARRGVGAGGGPGGLGTRPARPPGGRRAGHGAG